jgi:Holliday junction resolvasome RuvABC endonuclease subunit
MKKKILALDPSAGVSGWSFFNGKKITQAGWIQFEKTDYNGDRYLEAERWFKDMLVKWKPDLVLIEGYFFSSRFATGTSVNSEIRGCLKMAIREAELPYVVMNPTEWKKVLMGRVYPTRAEKKKYGKVKAKKVIVMNELVSRGFVLPEKILNPKTGKRINFKHDISDAIGILIAHLEMKGIQYKIHSDILGE